MTFKFLSNLGGSLGFTYLLETHYHSSGAGPQPCPRVKPSGPWLTSVPTVPPPRRRLETGSPRPFQRHTWCPSAAPAAGASPEDTQLTAPPPFAPPTLSWAGKPADLPVLATPRTGSDRRGSIGISALLSGRLTAPPDSGPLFLGPKPTLSTADPAPLAPGQNDPLGHAMLTLRVPVSLSFPSRSPRVPLRERAAGRILSPAGPCADAERRGASGPLSKATALGP